MIRTLFFLYVELFIFFSVVDRQITMMTMMPFLNDSFLFFSPNYTSKRRYPWLYNTVTLCITTNIARVFFCFIPVS